MFEKVKEYPVDPIMIGADLFAQDPREDKLNLTVGVYEDENGNTPILEAVKTAERRLADTQGTKAYTALTGDVEYCTTLGETIFGADVYAASGCVAAQTAGGAVALRLMADLVAQMPTRPTVWLQTPTYGNYIPILMAAGANWRAVPYYNRAQAEIEFEQMLDGLAEAKPGDLFLFQGVCNNPTGADMSPEQIATLLNRLETQGVVPWLDLAYLGFAQGWEADCMAARQIVDRFPECVVCITLSKSFGIYRDRAGALFVKTRAADRGRMERALTAIIRSSTSHAPDHGPSVVRTILQDAVLKAQWLRDLDKMRRRVAGIRQEIVAIEQRDFRSDALAFLGRQSGMFSLLPLSEIQETALTRDHGIHVVKGGRVNVARLRGADISTLVGAFHRVTQCNDRS